MTKKNEDSLLKSVQKTIGEVKEILAKAGVDYDEEEDMPEQPMEEAPMEEEQPMEEVPMEEEQPMEEEGEGDLVEHLKSLEDEELMELLSAIQAELEGRQGGEEEQQMSEQEEFSPSDMKKSISAMSSAIKNLTSQVSQMRKQSESQSKRLQKTNKAAASNKVDVMEKSNKTTTTEKKEDRLSKSDLIESLLNRRKNGDKNVTSNLINDLRYFDNDDEMYKYLRIKGIDVK